MDNLLKQHALLDAKIIAEHYAAHPGSERKSWTATVQSYRGKVIHQGFYRLSDGTDAAEDIVRYMHHIHDVLLRLILKKVNYDGEYRRAIPYIQNVPVDWVNGETPPSELGYT